MEILNQGTDDTSNEKQTSVFDFTPEEVTTRRLPPDEFEKINKYLYDKDTEHDEDTIENSNDESTHDIQTEADVHTDSNYNNTHLAFDKQRFNSEYSNSYGYNQYGNNGYKRRNRLGALEIAVHLAETEHIYNFNKALYIYDDSKGHYVYADSDAVIALARESLPISELKYLKHHESPLDAQRRL